MFSRFLLITFLGSAFGRTSAIALPAGGETPNIVSAAAESMAGALPNDESTDQVRPECQGFVLASDFRETHAAIDEGRTARVEHPVPPLRGDPEEPRLSVGIRGGFSLPENDLRLTTGSFPSFTIGAYGQYLIRRRHQLRPVGEWLYFSAGRQDIQTSSQSQTIKTNVRAVLMGGEYLYRFGGVARRLSAGGGFYLVRWSVASVNTLGFPAGANAEGSGTSHWTRSGEGPVISYRISRHLEIHGRWIRSNYGYEHIPVNVVTVGAGWRF